MVLLSNGHVEFKASGSIWASIETMSSIIARTPKQSLTNSHARKNVMEPTTGRSGLGVTGEGGSEGVAVAMVVVMVAVTVGMAAASGLAAL